MSEYLKKINDFYASVVTVQNFLWNNTVKKSAQLGYDLKEKNGETDGVAVRVTFSEAIKLCNALNELCGLKPVYTKNGQAIRCGIVEDIKISEKGIRLPFEKEWEIAAGGDTAYFWGDERGSNKSNRYAWMYDIDNRAKAFIVHTPAQKLPNRYGLYDISGNVYEWCFDRYKDTNFIIIKGGSVALDSILETKFTSYVPKEIEAIDIGLRLFSDVEIELPEFLLDTTNKPTVYNTNADYDITDILDFNTAEMNPLKTLCLDGKIAELKVEYLKRLKEYTQNMVTDFYELAEENIDDIMAIEKPEKYYSSDLFKNFLSYNNTLINEYITTNDEKYLDKLIFLVSEYKKAKDEFDNMTYDELNTHMGFGPLNWRYTQGFDSARLVYKTVVCVLNILKRIDARLITQKLAKAETDILTVMLTQLMPCAIKDARSNVPNQALECAIHNLLISHYMLGWKYSKDVFFIACERFKNALFDKCMLADGSDMEQSYNYNFSLLRQLKKVQNVIPNFFDRDFKIKEAAKYRARFLKAICYPFGGQPSSGTAAGFYPPAIYNNNCELEKYRKCYFDSWFLPYHLIDNEKITVNSVHFPYCGTSVMKNSDKVDAVYMWHFAPQEGSGHSIENINSVQLAGFGMPMLVNAGAGTYHQPKFFPEEQQDMVEEFEEYQHSSNGANTLMIDNMGQSRLKYGENSGKNIRKAPCGYRFFSDENFDFCEGIYEGEYSDGEKSVMAKHTRLITFIKKYDVLVIKDIVTAEGDHNFSLNFGIMPNNAPTRDLNQKNEPIYQAAGYDESDIIEENNQVFTDKKDAPNFCMYFCGNNKIKIHRGERHPLRGWFRGAIAGAAVPKSDIVVSWQAENITSKTTIIGAYKTEKNIVAIEENENIVIHTVKGDIMVCDKSVTVSGAELIYDDIEPIQGFSWEENEKHITPIYE